MYTDCHNAWAVGISADKPCQRHSHQLLACHSDSYTCPRVHTQEERLASFSRLLHSIDEQQLVAAVEDLKPSEGDELGPFEFRRLLHSLEVPISMAETREIFDAVDTDGRYGGDAYGGMGGAWYDGWVWC